MNGTRTPQKENPIIAELLKQYDITNAKIEERPYGWKITLDANTFITCLHKGMDKIPELQPHPGILSQHVTVLGPLHPGEKVDDKKYLLYVSRPRDVNKEETQTFGTGDSFFSFRNDSIGTGYYHVMLNTRTDDDILLLIKNEPIPAKPRTEN